MTNGMVPTEEHDGRIKVVVLNDKQGRQTISCSSYPETIAVLTSSHGFSRGIPPRG